MLSFVDDIGIIQKENVIESESAIRLRSIYETLN